MDYFTLLSLWFALVLLYTQKDTVAQTDEHEFTKTYGSKSEQTHSTYCVCTFIVRHL